MPSLKKLVVSCAVLILLFGLLCSFVYADESKVGTVNVSALNIREKPSTEAKVLDTIPKGTKVTVTGVSGDWCKITYNGINGWVFAQYVDVDNTSVSRSDTQGKKTGVVTASVLNVRKGAGTDFEVVAQLEKWTEVVVLSTVNGWYNISFHGGSGWVSSEYITFEETNIGTGVITGSVVNVRSGPGTEYEVLTTVKKSERVKAISRSGEWFKISTSGGTVGWVLGEYIDLSGSTVSRSASTATRNSGTVVESAETSDLRTNIVNYAKKFLGTKYVYGGSSPSKGFDCSGLVQYVFKQYGITLKRVAADQAKQGTKISKSELKPGDLVFFDTDGGKNYINHVGIYIGDNKFIHAANPKSGVVITSLSDDFYAKTYMTARRILN